MANKITHKIIATVVKKHHSRARIGEFLLRKGIVSPEILEKALSIQKREPVRRLDEILVEDLKVDHHAVFSHLAKLYAFKEIDLQKETIDEKRLSFIRGILENLPDETRRSLIEQKVVPLKLAGAQRDVLVVLTPDPANRAIANLAKRCGFGKVEIFYTRLDALEVLIDKMGPLKSDFVDIAEEASQGVEFIEEEPVIDEKALDAEINQSMLGRLVESSLQEAVRQRASDIHIVPKGEDRTEFHFRIDGKLGLWYTQENSKPEAISAVVKDRATNIDRFQRDIAQDGFVQRKMDGHLIRYRVSVLPTMGNEFDRKFESIVIRVLDDRGIIADLDKLGLQTKARIDFEKAITRPQGMAILTGPTGCGKSTTLNAALHRVMDSTRNVITVEEPVEYLIKGARQIKISDKLNFEQAVRAILRHDPDIVMVGEMRDLETAKLAITMANTGHLTFSTLHTNDAPSAVSRLYKMGVEPFLIANALNIVVAQRLVRKLCEDCKKPIKDIDMASPVGLGMTEEEIKDAIFYEAVGCAQCNGGYKGRVAITEALPFTKKVRHIILESGERIDEDAIREEAVKDGMLTLRVSGLERVKEGMTSFEEVASATAED